MKIIWVILVVGLMGIHSPFVFAGDGHDAGYEWAEEHDILDVNYDNGNSDSFNEGVRQYAEEQSEGIE